MCQALSVEIPSLDSGQAEARHGAAAAFAEDCMRAFLWIFGILSAANGLWMIVSPSGWFYGLPAGVPDTGPLNAHFVRDVGAAYLTFGMAFCFAASHVFHQRTVILIATIFYLLHALVHMFDLATGMLSAHHWLLDLPGVFLPAIVLLVLCAYYRRSAKA
jgi:hypothetical protein